MISNFEFSDLFPFLLIFSRVTAAIITLPGFAGNNINTQVRLLLSLSITIVMVPLLQDRMPAAPEEPYLFFSYIAFETFIGVFIGTMGRLLVSSVEVAGAIIGYQAGLMNAFIMNPIEGHQTALPATFLSIMVVTLFFVADLHHIALQAVHDSYQVFTPGNLTAYPNMTEQFLFSVLTIFIEAFMLSIQIAAPLLMLALLYFIGMGLLNRLMPQLHVFFVGQPFQIYMGLLILGLILVGATTNLLERLGHLYASLWVV